MLKKNRFKESNLKKVFDDSYNGLFAYVLYSFIFFLGKLKLGFLLKLFKKDANFFYRKNKYLEYKFKYSYKSKDFFKAYSTRIKQAIFLEKRKLIDKSYLDLIWHPECHDLFDLSFYEKKYLHERKTNFYLKESKKKENNILFFGPSADINHIEKYDFDFLCITKPINTEKLNIDSKKIILVLNNIWSNHKTKEVSKWINLNKDSLIFSPNNILGKTYNSNSFKKIPTFGFGSLMGLQRATTIVISEFNAKKIHFEGFDFYLSNEPIKSWYPSLYAEEGFKNQKQGILNATLNHDYLLNFLFMKKIKNIFKDNLLGEINVYLEKDVEYVLTRLRKLLS